VGGALGAHHLQVPAPRGALHEVGPSRHVINDGPLYARNHDVRALLVHLQ